MADETPNKVKGNRIEQYERVDGKLAWRIVTGEDNIIAVDGNQGYDTEQHLLDDLFAVFFGAYDESFLAAHKKWSDYHKESAGVEVPDPYVRQARRSHSR